MTNKLSILLVCAFTLSSCDPCIHAAKTIQNQHFVGVIVDKFFDTNYRMTPYVRFENGDEKYLTFNIYDIVIIGDSIYKEKGTLKHIIIRKNSKLILYPECKGQELYDERFK